MTGGPFISDHAFARYCERVADVTIEEMRVAIDTQAIRDGIAFGAKIIKLGTGQRLLIKGRTIVTVLPVDTSIKQLGRV